MFSQIWQVAVEYLVAVHFCLLLLGNFTTTEKLRTIFKEKSDGGTQTQGAVAVSEAV